LHFAFKIMLGMILAAGLGTRLRPITHTLPKPMVPVCNRPLVAYAVEAFRAAGIRELIVNLHYLPEPIERYLAAAFADCTFHFSYEPEILGTGGGVRKVRPLLESEEEFFLVNADTIQFPRYDDLRRARRERDSLTALTLRHPPGDDKFTPVYFDHGFVTGFGRGTGQPLMFSGSHLVSSRIFRYLPEKDFSGIVDEAYQPLLGSGRETIAGIVDDGLWFDIGTPQRLMSAGNAIRELMIAGELAVPEGSHIEGDSIVHESSVLWGAGVSPAQRREALPTERAAAPRVSGRDVRSPQGHVVRSSIGARSVIEGTVTDSAIWDDCHIAAGVTLERCIVTHGVEVTESHRDSLITPDAVTPI
jgi:mannose-1-phosphate guanylyltransferase